MNPKVIVLILSYNGKYLLEDCISSYLANNYNNFEVVVIDNGSTDGTKEWVAQHYPEVFVLRTEINLAYSGGFNFGLEYAFTQCQADYVLITNNDVKADSRVISELVKVAETNKLIGFVTGKVLYFDKPDILQTVGYETDPLLWVKGNKGHNQKDMGQFNKVEELDFSDDIFILVTKNCYTDTNGYDITFQFQVEQFDWQIRSKEKGYKIYYSPWAKIWHKESMTIGKSSPFKTYFNVRNTFIVRLKHREPEYLKIYSKYYLKNIVIIPFVKNVFKLKFKYAIAIFRAFCSVIIWGIKNKKIKLNYFFNNLTM